MMELIGLAICALLIYVIYTISNSNDNGGGGGGRMHRVARRWNPIPDRFKTMADVETALRKAGLESSSLIIGIDYTKSNTWQGKRTFGGRCLHDMSGGQGEGLTPGMQPMNPYQEVISVFGEALAPFDDDNLIPCFGFGDQVTSSHAVFPVNGQRDGNCNGFEGVLAAYNQRTPNVTLSGPTNFAPIIRKAIETVKSTGDYHILVIIADGEVTKPRETAQAIVDASNYALSIVVVGVGDGPWDRMEEYDDELPARRFDNFQFVNWNNIKENHDSTAAMAVAAMMEVPDQYQAIRDLKLL